MQRTPTPLHAGFPSALKTRFSGKNALLLARYGQISGVHWRGWLTPNAGSKLDLLVGIDQFKVSCGSLLLVVSARGASIYLPSLVFGVDWGVGQTGRCSPILTRKRSNLGK